MHILSKAGNNNLCIFAINFPKDEVGVYSHSMASIEAYANRIGATFCVADENKVIPANSDLPVHLEKFQVKELLLRYERVLSLDLDILINPGAPNIFDACPDGGKLYALEEGEYTSVDAEFFESKYGVIFPTIDGHRRVLNSGVVIWPKCALAALNDLDLKNFTRSFGKGTWGGEQTYLNMLLVKHDIPVSYLDKKWNWLLFEKEAVESRHNAHFVHYAAKEFKTLLVQDSLTLWRR